MDHKQVAASIKAHRLARWPTCLAASKALGLKNSTLHYWETGERAPGLDGLWTLADALGVTIDALVGRAAYTEGAPSASVVDMRRRLAEIAQLADVGTLAPLVETVKPDRPVAFNLAGF